MADITRDGKDRLVDSLEADLVAITDEIIAAIPEQIPAYQLADEIMLAEARVMVEGNLQAWLNAVRHRRMPTTGELQPFVDSARRRARADHPLGALLRAYRLGANVAWDRLAAATMSDPGILEDSLEVTGWIVRYIDHVSTVVSDAFTDERGRLESDADAHDAAVIDNLIRGVVPPGAAKHYRVSVVHATEDVGWQRSFIRWVRSGPDRPAVFTGRISEGVLVLIPQPGPPSPDELAEAVESHHGPALVSVTPTEAVDALAAPIEEAKLVARTALSQGRTGIVRLEEFLLTAVVQRWGGRTPGLLREVAAQIDAASDTMTVTVQALGATGSVKATAQHLGIHRNTVTWRLNRLHDATGRDPNIPADLLVLLAAVAVSPTS